VESLVGRLIGTYLSEYVKDFSADMFVDWSLTNLALRESVVQELAGIPAYLEVRRATCTKIAVRVPSWTALYSGSEPIVLQFERIEIELDEPVTVVLVRPPAPVAPVAPAAASASHSYVDRLLANIKFEIGQVSVTVKTLGSEQRLRVCVRDIVIHSTDDSYQAQVSGSLGVRVNRSNTESLQYRHVTLGRASLLLVDGARETALVEDTPLDVRVKMKRAVGSGASLAVQVIVELEKLAVRLGAHDYKQFEKLLDSLLDCVYRGEAAITAASAAAATKSATAPPSPSAASAPALAAPAAAAATTTTAAVVEPNNSDSYWSRLTSYFGRSYYADAADATSAATGTIATSSLDALEDTVAMTPAEGSPVASRRNSVPDAEAAAKVAEQAYLRSKFDELASQQLESMSLVHYDDDEDFKFTMYTFKVARGTVEALENVLQQPRRLAILEFEQLRLLFVPSVVRSVGAQSEARITIGSLVVTRDQAIDVHRDFERVVVAGADGSSSNSNSSSNSSSSNNNNANATASFEDDVEHGADGSLPALVLKYVRRDPASSALSVASGSDRFHRKVHVQTRNWTFVYDHRFWARVYQFFFGSELGNKFETYVDASVGMALGVVVTERVDVRVVALHNTLVLPPFAGYGGPEPLASHVLRLATSRASFGSSDAEADWRATSRVPDDMRSGLFAGVEATFPHRAGDYACAAPFIRRALGEGGDGDDAHFGVPTRSQRFAMRLTDVRCTMQDAPSAAVRTVLQPTTVDVDIVSQEYSRHSPLLALARGAQQRVNPRLEIYVRVRDMDVALTHAQYVYMLNVLDQRLAWSAAQLTEQQRAERIMEEIVRAADSGQVAVSAAEIERRVDELQQRRLEAVRDALKFVALVDMGTLRLTLFDDVVMSGSSSDVLANVVLAQCQLNVESDLRQSSTKLLVGRIAYQSPQYANTPFVSLFEPLSAASQVPLVAVRYDVDADRRAAHAFVALSELRIILLLDAIAKLQLFFDDKLARPAGAPDAAVEALRSTLRSAYTGSASDAASAASGGLEYDVQLTGCELALVETPKINEFVPMFIENGSLLRRAPTALAASLVLDAKGVTLFALLRETPQAPRRRDQLCAPLRMRAYWNQSCPQAGAPWISDIVLLLDDFVVTLTRPQLVMLQNILDYQLEGLAEAGKLQTAADLAADGSKPASAAAAAAAASSHGHRRGSFVVQMVRLQLSLKRDDDRSAFATLSARDFVYATEDAAHEWRMLIAAADLTLRDDSPSIALFETVLCRKPPALAAAAAAPAAPAAGGAGGATRLTAHRRSRLRDALRPARAAPRRRELTDESAWRAITVAAKDRKSFYGMISRRSDVMLLRIDHVSRLEQGRASQPGSAAFRADLDRRRLELGQQLALRGADAELLFQLACVHAQLGDGAIALDTLERAAGAGFESWSRLDGDAAFDSVRELPRFVDLLRKQRSLRYSHSSKHRYRAATRAVLAAREKAEAADRWVTRWVFDVNALLVVYTPVFASKLQAFFQLLDEQKNLRKQYNRISSQLAALNVDATMLSGATAPPPQPAGARSGDDDDDDDRRPAAARGGGGGGGGRR
jgi:hypothetical protein